MMKITGMSILLEREKARKEKSDIDFVDIRKFGCWIFQRCQKWHF